MDNQEVARDQADRKEEDRKGGDCHSSYFLEAGADSCPPNRPEFPTATAEEPIALPGSKLFTKTA